MICSLVSSLTHWTNVTSGKPVLGQLVDDYLMDFDIFHVSAVSELAHYVEAKYLCTELGGSSVTDVDQWLLVQVSLPPTPPPLSRASDDVTFISGECWQFHSERH